MRANGRFVVAIQLLGLLHGERSSVAGAALTSEQMAGIVDTNPVVVRWILGLLREAGLVTSQPGPGGGWRLLRNAGEVSLWDVLVAVEQRAPFSLERLHLQPGCPTRERLPAVLERCFHGAQSALARSLESVSVADVTDRDVIVRSPERAIVELEATMTTI